jgi:allantoate deiminase
MFLDAAGTVMARCATLARYSEEPDRLTRRFASPPMREVNALVAGWMQAAGMAVRQDALGNLIGRYEADRAGAKTLLLGSHLDTVRDAGKYDGPLGVLTALGAVERLHQAGGARLPFAIEVVAFADEEGLRCHTAYLGSKAFTGTLDPATLALTDADGVTLADAIRAFGGDPAACATDCRAVDDLLGYCEVHIEQGPVLEARGLPVGVVSAIAGQSRVSVQFLGEAGHAGTVPMAARHDALVAAAAFVLAVNTLAGEMPGLVATVGQLQVEPGASNVIPGRVTLSLDVRHQEDAQWRAACARLQAQAAQIAGEHGSAMTWHVVQETPAVPCGSALTARLARAVAAQGIDVLHLPSGAGHDGVVLAGITEIAMLFVRCERGISHNPAEAVTEGDVAVALDVLGRFLDDLAAEQGS